MSIEVKLSELMADRGMSLKELANLVGIANVILSRIKTGKIKAVRLSTLDSICDALGCQPGDILSHVSEDGEYVS